MLNRIEVTKYIFENKWKYIYNGTVVDNKDPDKLSRIKVSIPELTKDIPTDYLPWYIIKGNISSSPNANTQIPPLGSSVIVEFPNEDIYNGLVSWQISSIPPSS